jgi:O-antigen/teichoic acid export membrane protein
MLRIIATIGAIQVLAICVTLVRSKILAVTLGPEGVGVTGLIDQVVQLVNYISAFSLPFISVKFLSRAHSTGPEAFRRTYSNFLQMLLILTTSGAAIGSAVVFYRPELLGTELAGYRAFLIPALLCVPAMALHGLFTNVLAAAQRPKQSGLLALFIAIAMVTTTYVGINAGGILGLYWGNLVACATIVAAVLVYFRSSLHLPFLDRTQSILRELHDSPGIITFAAIIYLSSCSLSLALLVGRYTILSNFGEAQTGLLQSVLALSGAINLVLNPANGLYLTPMLNRDLPRATKIAAALEFQRKLLLVMVAVAMGMVLFPQWILSILYSPSFVQGSGVLFLFVAAQCLTQLAGVHQALLIGLDDLKTYGLVMVVSYLVLGALSWLLGSRLGMPGVALAALASAGSIFMLTFWRLARRFGLELPARSRWSIIYGLLALLVVGAVFRDQDPGSVLVIFAKLAIFTSFAGSLLLFLNPDERHALFTAVGRALHGESASPWMRVLGRGYRRVAAMVLLGAGPGR